MKTRLRNCAAVLMVLAAAGAVQAQEAQPVKIAVDATEVGRGIYHVKQTVPAQPGKMTLTYPEWIPGHHRSAGPVINLVGLKLSAGGKPVTWRRDEVDMYAFHCEVPAGATALDVSFDYVTAAAGSSTIVIWNEMVLYPKGKPTDQIPFAASLKLPAGWKYATSLRPAAGAGGTQAEIAFAPVSLTMLIDSPVLTGSYFKSVAINPGQSPPHFIDMVSESDAGLQMKPELVPLYGRLVDEAGALFGARHYTQYRWLLTLNSKGGGGLEHHESSDDHAEENAWSTEGGKRRLANLLAHEYVHSWCGKFRRPAGLATPDYQEPMKGELLWVYEGLTDYLALIMCPRAGLVTAEEFRERLALTAASMDYTVGRSWRPLADTAIAAPITYGSPGTWRAYRRSTDFYPEGDLLWLEVDVMIRQQTGGKKSMNDFCLKFFGGEGGKPSLKTYTMDDVVATLNEVSPFDWKGFLNTRLNSTEPRAPLAGVTGGGWKVVYNDTPNEDIKYSEGQGKTVNLTYSLGLLLGSDDGVVRDIVPGMIADKAGLAPGMKLIAVNGRKWSGELLRTAVKDSKTATGPIELLIENNELYKTYSLNYHDGARYPHMERDGSKPDVLGEIVKPMVVKP